jgi:hypothetical protein
MKDELIVVAKSIVIFIGKAVFGGLRYIFICGTETYDEAMKEIKQIKESKRNPDS